MSFIYTQKWEDESLSLALLKYTKRIFKKGQNIIAGLVLVMMSSGCSESEHVSSEEFINTYNKIEMGQTMHEITYLGKHEDKYYIQVKSMSLITQKFSDRLIYVEKDELNSSFRQSLPQRLLKN